MQEDKLRSLLSRATEEPPKAENLDESGLPDRTSGQYQPYSRPANKPLYSLHFVSPAGTVTSMQYVHLDSHSTYTAECITLTFLGIKAVKVAIHGRCLWKMYDLLHQHRIAWIMHAPRDFAQDGETVITKVTFEKVKLEYDESTP